MDRQELINAIIRREEGVEQSGFPLDAFPQTVQEIVLGWSQAENYVKEYSAMSLICALSASLGNALHVRIKANWTTNASIYCVLVGRPGIGKTPPLNAAFKPIREKDKEFLRRYCDEIENYQANKDNEESKKPRLRQTVVNDFTPEAMLEAHNNNLRGIVILVDEIMGMFNSVNRYTSGQLIEQLLSAWSGISICVIRKSSPKPLHIACPCINIIGSIQTKIVGNLFEKNYVSNGFLDRFIFVYPKFQKIPLWSINDIVNNGNDLTMKWSKIINRVFGIECVFDELSGEPIPKVLEFSQEAKNRFFEWKNAMIQKTNGIEDDSEIDDREMKHDSKVARFALLFQVAKWACGEGNLEYVDEESVKSAIRLNNYLEDSFQRLKESIAEQNTDEASRMMLDEMSDIFTTKDAEHYGNCLGVTTRTVLNWLKKLVENGYIRHEKKGMYSKTHKQGSEQSEICK